MTTEQLNADQAELAKFDDLANTWWDPDGEFRPLHDLNPTRAAFISTHAHLDGVALLDVGCGGGILSEAMAEAGAEVTGIDLAEKALTVANLHRLESELDIDYRLISVEDLARKSDASFDVITCLEMLEHVPSPESVIESMATLLKPGGICFLSTINRTPRAFALGVVAAEYVLNILARGTHEYRKFIKPSELDRACRSAGLELIDLKGLAYNPFSRQAALKRDVSINYICAYRKI